MKLLILGQGLLPLESRDALVFLVDLEALEVLIDFGLLKLEVNADLGELLLFQGRRYEVLNLGLLANDKVVLVLGQLLLVVFRGFAVIFLLRLVVSCGLRLLINGVTIALVVIAARTSTVVTSVATSVLTVPVPAASPAVPAATESSLLILSAIFTGIVHCIKDVVAFSSPLRCLLCLIIATPALVIATPSGMIILAIATTTALLVVRPLLASRGCLYYLFVLRGIRALSCTLRHLNLSYYF